MNSARVYLLVYNESPVESENWCLCEPVQEQGMITIRKRI